MSIDLARDFADAEEKIDGDTALLVPNSGTSVATEPYHLKKDAGNWKIDLSFLDKDPTAKQFSEKKMPAVTKVWDQATEEVQSGKFDTFAQAAAAVKFRVAIAQKSDAEGRLLTARADLQSFEAALEAYKSDAAEFPQTQDGLLALTQKAAAATNWHGPYLKKSITADPWGNAYIYVSPGLHNTNAYDLHSMGPTARTARLTTSITGTRRLQNDEAR